MGLLQKLFGRTESISVRIGIFGEVGAGKTTLVNYITRNYIGVEVGKVTGIPHETREIKEIENVLIRHDGKELNITIVDTPGLATYIDYREFMKYGLSEEEAIERAKEATKGVVEALKEFEKVDVAIIVVDSTKLPFNQINAMLIGNLEIRKIPFIIAANKIDRDDAKPDVIKEIFQNKPVVPISALTGENVDKLIEEIAKRMR